MTGRRHTRRTAVATTLVIAMLLTAAPADAGWVIDQVVRAGGDRERSRHRVFMQANRVKVETGDGVRQSQAMVMDLDAETITQVDYPARAYVKATVTEYAELMRQAGRAPHQPGRQPRAAGKDLEERLTSLPAEQRRAIEAMMKQGTEPPVRAEPARRPEDCLRDKIEVKATGRKITVAGYEASGYVLSSDGRPDSEVYIARAITAAREVDPEKLERLVAQIVRAMPHCPPRGQMFGAGLMWKLMKDGYPVRSIGMEGGPMTEVVKVEVRSLGADEFEPPAGFARKTLAEMMGGK